MMKTILTALMIAAAAVLWANAEEHKVISFRLNAGTVTNAVPDLSAYEGYSLVSWGVGFGSNVWGDVVLYKQFKGNNIEIGTLSTTNTGRFSLMAAPVKLTKGDSLVVDCTGLTGLGGWFNGTTLE